jgi:hypothetical protein
VSVADANTEPLSIVTSAITVPVRRLFTVDRGLRYAAGLKYNTIAAPRAVTAKPT